MTHNIEQKVTRGAGGRIYAVVANEGRVSLVCLGDHATVRYWFDQIACLVGGWAVQTLLTYGPGPTRIMNGAPKPPHHWEDVMFGDAPVGSAESLYQLAARGPSPDADKVGYLAFSDVWPEDMHRIPGVAPLRKSMGQSLGRVFFDCLLYPTVNVGSGAEQTIARRTHEAIVAAKRAGYTPYDEPALIAFLETLTSARALQFFHEVNPA